MQIKQLIEDEDAVSPVIGVILMVAITVILAAVIGTFVLGLGDQVSNTAPSASFTFDYEEVTSGTQTDCWGTDVTTTSDHPLTITHDGGDKITASRLDVKGGNTDQTVGDGSCMGASSEITAGTTFDYAAGTSDTVRIVWTASGGGDSATLGKWTGPDA